MNAERVTRLVARWVRFYTRKLPEPIAQRRIDEIEADLHDNVAHERARGTKDRRIALGIAARMLRGLPADVSWGRQMSKPSHRPLALIALVTALILLVPLVAMQFTDEVDWGVADFVAAAVLLAGAGLLLRALAGRSAGHLAYQAVAGVIGVAAIVFGEADDAPGLILFGGLLILATVALAIRTVQRSQ